MSCYRCRITSLFSILAAFHMAGVLLGTSAARAQLAPPPSQAQLSQPIFFSNTTEDKFSLFGNRLGKNSMYGLGVESNTLYYKSNGHHRWYSSSNANGGGSALMSLTRTGRLGIGTSNPNHELVVQGNDPTLQIRDDSIDNSSNAARLELLERAGGSFDGGAFLWWNGQSNKLFIGTKNRGTNRNVLVINRSGLNVGIGTSNPHNDFRLSVNGKIRAKEIVLETGWSDFVFDEDYNLMEIEEVAAFIEQYGRLPDVPSAEQVATEGLAVGDMGAKLLQKVEELTLYVIEMNRRLRHLETENSKLRDRFSETGGAREVQEGVAP